MSALTKVFVVLHVVLSMILVAGLVVFVNRTEDFRKANINYRDQLATATRNADNAAAEFAVVRADYDHKLASKETETTTLRQALGSTQEQVAGLNADKAKLSSDLALANAANTSLGEALKSAQAANGTMQANYAELRKSQDGLQKQFTDANLQIDDLQNKLDVTTKHDRIVSEENVQLSSDLQEKAQQTLHQANLDQNPRVVNQTPSVKINGVVRDKKVIDGVPYATISVGSADAVAKNMRFIVVDNVRSQFLGYLTVDSVEPHEATGRLDGPHIADVKTGTEVRTQL